MARPRSPIDEQFAAACQGQRRSIGRLLSLIERGGSDADEVTHLAHPLAGAAHVIGITGPPGSGKSTLTGRLVAALADAGHSPAVLAVDPSSPLSGGAILGDRIRMAHVDDERVFIRSMATRGHAGGLALAVPGAVRLLDAVGFDPVIIETVGVGQVEVDVATAADTTVVVVPPGAGDAVQANKAGLLEVADVFVVNKADRPGAAEARRDLELMLDLSHVSGQEERVGGRPPVLMTDALQGTGTDDLVAAFHAHHQGLIDSDRLDERRQQRVTAEVKARLVEQLGRAADDLIAGSPVIRAAEAREISPAEAAARLFAQMFDG